MTHESGHVIDVMSTCLDVAGARYPTLHNGERVIPMEGRSLAAAFQGKSIARKDAFYWEHEGNRAVVDGRYKLVSRFPNRWELYDLEADRCEMRDLSGSDAARVQRMVGRYDEWAGRCNVLPWEEVRKIKAEDGGG
jgi:arylsulfatase